MKLLAIPAKQPGVSPNPQFITTNEQQAVDFSIGQSRIHPRSLAVGKDEQAHAEGAKPKPAVSTLRQRDNRRRGQTGQYGGLCQLLNLSPLETKRPPGDVRHNNSSIAVFRHGGDLRGLHPDSVLDAFKLAVILAYKIDSFRADP